MQEQKGDDNWFPDIFHGEAGGNLTTHMEEDGRGSGKMCQMHELGHEPGEKGGTGRSELLPFMILFLVIKPNNCVCLFY